MPLDSIEHKRLQHLLRIHRATPSELLHEAEATGALTDSSVFSISGQDVTCLFVPSRYLISQQSVEGANIMSMPDTDYALMARERLLKAVHEGPVYYELAGTLNNEYLHYLNLAIPVPGPHNKVIASTVVLEHEIRA